MPADTWSGTRNLLCIRLDQFGDVLMATPAFRALKDSAPDRRITLLTSPAGAEATRFIPEIDDTIEYSAPWMKNGGPHDAALDLTMIAQLRARRFDGAVIFNTYSQSPLPAAMLCMLAGIPLCLAHCHENPYRLLSDWVPDPEPRQQIRHEVRRQLDLVAAIGARTGDERLSFALHHNDLAWARSRLSELDIDHDQPWLLLHPGSSAASRRYPSQLWAQATAELARQLRCPLVFSGTTAETPLVDGIMAITRRHNADARLHSIAGTANLGQFAAVMSLAAVVITNNTGPAHLAAALGMPVVDLYALTNPQHTPWKTPSRVLFHDVPCRFCYKSVCPQGHQHCLALVEPARVVNAACDLLQNRMAGLSGDGDEGKPLVSSWPG